MLRLTDLDRDVLALHAAMGGGADPLLDRDQAAALVRDMDPSNWGGYATQWDALLAGMRPLRVIPGTEGRDGWIRSYVHYHVRVELRQGEALRLPSPRAKKPAAKAVLT